MLHSITLVGYAARPLTSNDVDQAVSLLAKARLPINGREELSPNEAHDIFMEGDAEAAKECLAGWALEQKLDLFIQPYQGRRKKALLADMESTIIKQEMLDELAERAGVGEKVKEITRRSMNGEVDFKEALIERLALLKGVNAGVVQELVAKIIYMPGAKELVGTLRRFGVRTVLVSGGFTVFTAPVAKRLGFDEHYGNILGIHAGVFTGLPIDPILTRETKLAKLKELGRQVKGTEQDVCAVGDGANDLLMIMAAGMGVAYHGKPVVAEKAPFAIRFADLRAVLFAMGYRKAEIGS
ncbi:MAG: phosphoserine phosphatase SerB [Proteobacteria bacterium]|nr:phosphoserine phosphatase SerB [Pseudomonadota bacterium]